MARKNSKEAMDIDEISYEYEVEETGFDEEIVGTPVASFSFNNNTIEENPLLTLHHLNTNTKTNLNTTSTSNSKLLNSSKENEIQNHSVNNFSTPANINNCSTEIVDNRVGKPKPNGITPPIDGEPFDLKRTYPLRSSTVRKLSELKAAHPDVNAYLSTILDAAIVHYYNYIFVVGGSQQ